MFGYSRLSISKTIDKIIDFIYCEPIIQNRQVQVAISKEMKRIDKKSYVLLKKKLFPGQEAHPTGARIDYDVGKQLLRITLEGLPYGVMTKFITQIRQSLIWQGFLLPTMTAEWLITSGSTRIVLPIDETEMVRELQPTTGLTIRSHPAPFLLVEVVDSDGYVSGLEKGIWTLENSNGATKLFILISLVRKDGKGKSKANAQCTDSAKENVIHKHQENDFTTNDLPKFAQYGESSIEDSEIWAGTSGYPSPGPCSTPQSENDSTDSGYEGQNLVATAAKILTAMGSNPDRGGLYDCFNFSPQSSHDSSAFLYKLDMDREHTYDSKIDGLSSISSPDDPNKSPAYPFSMATITVLTCVQSDNNTIGCRIKSLLSNVEVWPTAPGPEDEITFGWPDMPMVTGFNPGETTNRTFTIRFQGLHKLMNDFINTGNPDSIKEQEQYSIDDLNFDDLDMVYYSDSDGGVDLDHPHIDYYSKNNEDMAIEGDSKGGEHDKSANGRTDGTDMQNGTEAEGGVGKNCQGE